MSSKRFCRSVSRSFLIRSDTRGVPQASAFDNSHCAQTEDAEKKEQEDDPDPTSAPSEDPTQEPTPTPSQKGSSLGESSISNGGLQSIELDDRNLKVEGFKCSSKTCDVGNRKMLKKEGVVVAATGSKKQIQIKGDEGVEIRLATIGPDTHQGRKLGAHPSLVLDFQNKKGDSRIDEMRFSYELSDENEWKQGHLESEKMAIYEKSAYFPCLEKQNRIQLKLQYAPMTSPGVCGAWPTIDGTGDSSDCGPNCHGQMFANADENNGAAQGSFIRPKGEYVLDGFDGGGFIEAGCFRFYLFCINIDRNNKPGKFEDFGSKWGEQMKLRLQMFSKVTPFQWTDEFQQSLSAIFTSNEAVPGTNLTMVQVQTQSLNPVCQHIMRDCTLMRHFEKWLVPVNGLFQIDPKPGTLHKISISSSEPPWEFAVSKKVNYVAGESIMEKRMLCVTRPELPEECCVSKGLQHDPDLASDKAMMAIARLKNY